MAINSGNGWCKFSLGIQHLVWNTGTANVYTADPVDSDGVRLEGEDLAAVTVAAGDTVGDGYDTTYWTVGEGPVECVLCTVADAVVYNGSPFFRVEGAVVEVHPSQDQIESTFSPGSLPWSLPETPATITGAQGTDDTAILVALLGALDRAGIINDATTGAE